MARVFVILYMVSFCWKTETVEQFDLKRISVSGGSAPVGHDRSADVYA